ncbi:MAG: MmcQ/YjbR family DNA-binding protein [Pseudomonadota bacterium]
MMDFNAIRTLAARLPGTEESTSYGTPAIKVRKKLLLRLHQKEDAIVLLLDTVDEQQALIAQDPMTFYITDHYDGYAAVLVRPTVPEEVLFELMVRRWQQLASKAQLAAFDAGSD